MGRRVLQSRPLKIKGLGVWGPISGDSLLSVPWRSS